MNDDYNEGKDKNSIISKEGIIELRPISINNYIAKVIPLTKLNRNMQNYGSA